MKTSTKVWLIVIVLLLLLAVLPLGHFFRYT